MAIEYYIETENNIADLFTKYVPNPTLGRLRPAIMGRETPPKEKKIKKNDTKQDNKVVEIVKELPKREDDIEMI